MSSPGPRHERFTDRARRVMQLANLEALRLGHEYVGTEHVLLGIIAEGSGVAAVVLKNLGLDLQGVRREVELVVHPGPRPLFGLMPHTPHARQLVNLAVEERRSLNDNSVGTDHLLLGLLRVEEGVAAQVLMNLGLGLEDVRAELLYLRRQGSGSQTYPKPFPKEDVPDYPAAVRQALEELDATICQLDDQKVDAVATQDFDQAALLRDQADRLKQKKRSLLRTWHLDYPIDPSWLTRNGGAAVKVAETIGAERRWEDLPILADALEEAGCTNAEMLAHCRAGAQHARRCWVVDLLRGAV